MIMTDTGNLAMYIGGQWVAATDGAVLPIVNPTTEEHHGTIPAAGAKDVAVAVEAAAAAGPGWAARSWMDRGELLRELARRIEERVDELAMMDAVDGGNPVTGMRGDVRRAVEEVRYYAGLGGELKGDTIPWTEQQFGQTFREPYGVVGRITAYNHPFQFAITKVAAPLVAGNTVVLKPSEHTSTSALRLAELTADLLPPGVLNVVTGTGSDAGAALVEHPDVPRISFTGGVPTGRAILRAAAEHIKHVSLELGGKNPMIVCPDVDLDAAARAAVAGMGLRRSTGQSCQSTSRILVHDSIAAEFTERVLAIIGGLRIGDPREDDVEIGPLGFRAHYERVLSYIDIGREEGARLLIGGGRPEGVDRGWFVAPTVFADVTPDMRIATEEIFGPVVSLMTWSDEDEAIRLANGVEYGLTANIWTNDFSGAYRIARAIQAGTLWINGAAGARPVGVPFGGYKQSGLGREACLGEVLSFTREKSMILNFPS
jgi:betaine-aldehyde dehydrogenase